jgi:hypothetical protein
MHGSQKKKVSMSKKQLLIIIALSTLTACSSAETAPAAAGAAADRPAPATREAQAEGPCILLTTAEVRRAFPDAKAGELNRTQEKYGVVSCMWDYPGGRFSIIGGDDDSEGAHAEARGWTLMFLDPLRQDAKRHVRYETLSGVGDEAVAIVERQDKEKGFLQDGAILVVRRGKRQVSAMSSDLARRERAEALKVFEDLGKAIVKRLE